MGRASPTVGEVMKPAPKWLPESTTLGEATKWLVGLRVNVIPVCSADRRLKGLVTPWRIVKSLAFESDLAVPVGDIASPAVAVRLEDSLAHALAVMKRHRLSVIPVIDGAELVGSIAKADIRAVFALDAQTPGPLVLDIAPAELRFGGDLAGYMSTAASAVRCVKLAMLATGRPSLTRILDFGCGRGRVMRLFKAAFPEAELVACDTNAAGVDFCASAFGATPVYASDDPAEIAIDGRFDLIWCGSLLTHLDAPRWAGFIELFRSLLHPDGMMLVTSHGHAVARKLETRTRVYGLSDDQIEAVLAGYRRDGFGYADYESTPGYGFSVSSPAWTYARLEEIGGLRIGLYMERGWSEHHDVIACLPAEGSP
jgi:CBS domain-containing protein